MAAADRAPCTAAASGDRRTTIWTTLSSSRLPLTLFILRLVLSFPDRTVAGGLYGGGDNRRSRCERITIPMCRDMPYNMTRMPNLIDDQNQQEAGIRVHEFKPLVESGCSKHLKFFLCSLFAPMCTEQVDVPIPSCRAICEEVKASCYPLMQKFNFPWPPILNCSRLPVPEKNGLCMQFPNITDERTTGSALPGSRSGSGTGRGSYPIRDGLPTAGFNIPTNYPIGSGHEHPLDGDPGPGVPRNRFGSSGDSLRCSKRFVFVERAHGQKDCAPQCGMDVYFRRSDKEFAEIWMTLWSTLCFVSTLFTVLTFWIDMDRFKYPERPIIFLSMCYLVYSSAFLLRMFVGPQSVSCDQTPKGESHLILEGLESTRCIVVFLLLYYFGMAGSIWWVILTLTWFLSAGKKWGHEAIESYGSYFHVAAWGFPAIKTIVVLTLRRVDGEELTGLCYVGNQDLKALTGFVIVPLCVYAVLGVFFFLLGFVALFRIRRVMKRGGRNIDKLERLMVRIGVFSGLYTVPALCVLACHLYEHWNYHRWKTLAVVSGWDCDIKGQCELKNSIPSVEVYMLKIVMSLIAGVTSGVWIWSSKTWHSWRDFFFYRFSQKYRRRKCSQIQYLTPAVLAPLNPPQPASRHPQGQQPHLAGHHQQLLHPHAHEQQRQLHPPTHGSQPKSTHKGSKLSHVSRV